MILNIKPVYWFFIAWLTITAAAGMWNHFAGGPEGMHQGAQADRASIAWNYYSESFNFFKPRVMETRAADGVTGMEFPIVNYTAALLYKLFGPHEFLYRGLMFGILTCGIFAAFLITGFFIQRTLSRLLITFGWALSPLVFFYGNSFVPDPAAMAISMVAIYWFFRYYFLQRQSFLYIYLLFTALAALIKVTYLLPHFAFALIYLVVQFKPKIIPNGFPKPRFALIWFILPLLPAAAWYTYSGWLTRSTGNEHFLQQINPAKTLPEFFENTRYAFNTWQESIYAGNVIYIITGLFLVTVFTQWRRAPMLALFSGFLFTGFLSVLILFSFQFRYHDYYFFLLLLSVFFILLFLQQVYLEGMQILAGLLPIVAAIGLYYLPFGNFFHGRKMLEERYTPGSYYYQNAYPEAHLYSEFYQTIEGKISRHERVISAFDPSPNTSLYLLRRQGIRIAPDFSPELTRELFEQYNYRFLVLNDSVKWEQEYEPVINSGKRLLLRHKLLSLWELK